MKKILFSFFSIVACFVSFAQVAINTTNTAPDASAILDVSATNKGLLLPRMTMDQRNAIQNPATGLFIYQTDNTPGFYVYDGTTWTPVNDNLGNHKATQGLNIGTNRIYNTNSATGLKFEDNGAFYLRTQTSIQNSIPTTIMYLDRDGGFFVKGTLGYGIIPAYGPGYRMMWYPYKSAFRAGGVDGYEWDDYNTGFYSAAFGHSTVAYGTYSFASGEAAQSLGAASFSGGYHTEAQGNYSSSLGYVSKARATASSVFGYNVVNMGYASTVIGMYNDSLLATPQTNFTTATPLFIVGNGDAAATRSNALVIQKDGRVFIDPSNKNAGAITSASLVFGTANGSGEGIASRRTAGTNQYGIDFYTNFNNRMTIANNGYVGIGTITPANRLDVVGLNNWDLTNTEGDMRVGNSTYRLKFGVALGGGGAGAATIMQYGQPGGFNALTLGSQGNGVMTLFGETGNVGIGTTNAYQRLTVAGNICASGSIASCSDIRYKTNILPVSNVLSSVLAIQPIYYNWKKEFKDKGFTEDKQLGFSAQEIEKYFPEVVQTDAQGYKAVDYSRMTPVLVEAIKEQQKEIEELKKEIEELRKLSQEVNEMKQQLQKLMEKK